MRRLDRRARRSSRRRPRSPDGLAVRPRRRRAPRSRLRAALPKPPPRGGQRRARDRGLRAAIDAPGRTRSRAGCATRCCRPCSTTTASSCGRRRARGRPHGADPGAAARDKEEQIAALRGGRTTRLAGSFARPGVARAAAGTPFAIPDEAARDRVLPSSFYWPDVLDPVYPYGEGIRLQLRSAVSHLNEVWAVDTAGAILWALAPELGWDWVPEAGRGRTTRRATC